MSLSCRAVLPRILFLGVSLVLACLSAPLPAAPGDVTLLRTPNGGIQPQALVDSTNTLHLIYFAGDSAQGDIFYVHKKIGTDSPFSAPVRVNSIGGSAIAVGTIRGAQMAVGKAGRVCVSWNGVEKKSADGSSRLYAAYARLNESGTGFEPQRNLLGRGSELDGGGAIAAAGGDVYVFWHSAPPEKDEAAGAVYMVHSNDGGKTFGGVKRISVQPTGECGCCSMRAFVNQAGDVFVLYRAAGGNFDRDTTLLVSRDRGRTFRAVVLSRWKLGACPMSSFSLAEGRGAVVGAWETAGQVYQARLTADMTEVPPRIAAPGTGNRKYPVVTLNAAGEMLFAWVEGAGWQQGGALAWQVYDNAENPVGLPGRRNGVPAWSLVSAVARPDGSFLVIY